ncbi:DUF3995 domain-containing protein [Streptomyces sp. NPDC056061]|uniref:DUF3995 domain-containing protein n=1 Tax=Streptomyces sp. NPDC056061 TaxID=3345700 RepID=UPI0035E235B8
MSSGTSAVLRPVTPVSGAPGPVACFAVAGALGTAALPVAGRPRRRPALSRLGAVGVAAVLGVRGAAGLSGRTDLLSPGSVPPHFRRLDRIAYSPLRLAIAATTAVATTRRGRAAGRGTPRPGRGYRCPGRCGHRRGDDRARRSRAPVLTAAHRIGPRP